MREYSAVHGCLGQLTAVVVAVTVAVGDTSGSSASEAENH
jgi:soluble P-type ATPase